MEKKAGLSKAIGDSNVGISYPTLSSLYSIFKRKSLKAKSMPTFNLNWAVLQALLKRMSTS